DAGELAVIEVELDDPSRQPARVDAGTREVRYARVAETGRGHGIGPDFEQFELGAAGSAEALLDAIGVEQQLAGDRQAEQALGSGRDAGIEAADLLDDHPRSCRGSVCVGGPTGGNLADLEIEGDATAG